MLRHSRLVLTILVAMFIVAVPSASAQSSPVADQYQSAAAGGDDAGTAAANSGGGTDVADVSGATANSLPFTGGQVALIALIGLGLLALGAAGLAVTRGRGPSNTA
jgi:hypothetical protein